MINKRVAQFQSWLQALVRHKESWQLRELLEFLDDSSCISSRLTWTWNNWQSPVMSVNDSSDLEQLQMDNLFVVLGRGGSSVQAQGRSDVIVDFLSLSINAIDVVKMPVYTIGTDPLSLIFYL